jgi:flavin-binding protein dodecin
MSDHTYRVTEIIGSSAYPTPASKASTPRSGSSSAAGSATAT